MTPASTTYIALSFLVVAAKTGPVSRRSPASSARSGWLWSKGGIGGIGGIPPSRADWASRSVVGLPANSPSPVGDETVSAVYVS